MSQPLHDNVPRTKSADPLGRATFIILRVLDVWWQSTLLHQGWASKLITTLGGTALTPATNPHLPTYHTLITLLALGSTIKQSATMLFISEQSTPISSAILIAFFNTLLNTLNSIFAVWSFTSQAPTHLLLHPRHPPQPNPLHPRPPHRNHLRIPTTRIQTRPH
ncbi:hypothetical protein ASPCADRAFT_125569 [Aspergillus carbonarius ITEM 5010]|uniref:Uncharacterized protein n=1 Tax=Aspergillus carbonarius (strain ITEM 5010) TaxID=602072 RepID=A0A1R3S1D2_ASPC5|nr:hypothetical protein ASPCADRAFT_125569 [Aspergillus carbonarius ITEM 5010]